MDRYEVFYINKNLNPFADLLVVAGLARLIEALFHATGEACHQTLSDRGLYYELRLSPAMDETRLAQRVFPARAIQTEKTGLPENIPAFVYEEERERVSSYLEALKRKVKSPEKPGSRWDVLRAINPAVLPGYNALMVNWYTVAGQPDVLRLLFNLFSSFPNHVSSAKATWQQLNKARRWGIRTEATCQQLYNPDSGKGQNRAKANGLNIDNIDNFWLVEWLKAVGFYDVALTRLVRGSNDRKTFVLAPCELTYGDHRAIMDEFVNTMPNSEPSVRLDLLAVIRYMQALLRHFTSSEFRLAALLKSGHIKKRLVSGFYTAFYKDMGNASATMNMAFIALPGWVQVQSQEDVLLYQALLDELDLVVVQFDESHSDAFRLLQYLRDFVSGDDLTAFFRFTSAFPSYLLGMRERNLYSFPLSTGFIERLMMSSDQRLSGILQTPGFQNIAYAIRQATVTAQYRRKQGNRRYTVHYGLGQALTRKARYPGTFITALSDFLHQFNAENAQIIEAHPGPYRRSIQTTDIEQIVALIDVYGSETVANLLIAYGYARVKRDGDAGDDLPAEEEHQGME